MSHEHGAHDPDRGWYDASRAAWVDSPSKLTPMQRMKRWGERKLDAVEHRADTPSTEELRAKSNAAAFRPDPRMEQLRALRDSNRAEDRERFRQQARGGARMSLGSYENQLQAHLAAGNELPEGVQPPKGTTP